MNTRQRLWERLCKADSFAAKWWPVLIPLFAVVYYGLYFFDGLFLSGEGGTVTVIAMRLLEGKLPFKDTFLGYNLGWFAPVAGLFAITGPNYTLLRAYFFGIAIVSALIGAFTAKRLSGSGLWALGTGVMLVLIPGAPFRTYMGLLGVLNQLTLLWALAWPARSGGERIARLAAAGAVLGLTFLVRIEVGLLLLPVYAGMLLLWMLWPGKIWRRVAIGVVGACAGAVCWGIVHAPVAWDAHRRGYAESFWGQYDSMPRYLWALWQEKKRLLFQGTPAGSGQSGGSPMAPFARGGWAAEAGQFAEEPKERWVLCSTTGTAEEDPIRKAVASWRKRPAVHEIWTAGWANERYFAAAVHLPVVLLAGFLLAGLGLSVAGAVRQNEQLAGDGRSVLCLVGASLALFPQYYFFRPDTPHVSEFMIPFFVAVSGITGLALRRWHESGSLGSRVAAAAMLPVCALVVWVHIGHAWKKGSAGTIALRPKQGEIFRGDNGVIARVPPETARGLAGLKAAIQRHSHQGEDIVVFPYAPTIHVFADRPSYLWNLYMDDANSSEWFLAEQIRLLKEHRPPVVVIDNRAVNRTERSRFKNWAAVIFEHIRQNYVFEGTYADIEVYVLPERASPAAQPPGTVPGLPDA